MRGFREVGWVAAVGATALGCYMVSLKVAAERAVLEDVQDRIVLAQRDIRVLQTEIGTRGRLEQLESWNGKVLALSAPQAHQFLEGGFQLATLAAPSREVDPAAPVVLASAPAPETEREIGSEAPRTGATARDLMQVASLRRDLPSDDDAAAEKAVDKKPAAAKTEVKPVAKAASASTKPAEKVAPAPSSAAKDKSATKDKSTAKDKKAATAKAEKPAPKAAPKPKDVQARQ